MTEDRELPSLDFTKPHGHDGPHLPMRKDAFGAHRVRWYARDGSEITMEQWSKLLGDDKYRQVARTEFGDVVVSTVWLGLDHNWLGQGPPIIFETMIFGGQLDQDQWRYATEAQALDGHAAAVEQARVAYQLAMPDAVVQRPVRADEEKNG